MLKDRKPENEEIEEIERSRERCIEIMEEVAKEKRIKLIHEEYNRMKQINMDGDMK